MAIERDDVATRVKNLVGQALEFEPTNIKDEHRLIEDLGADSLDLIELLMSLEEEFGIDITDEQVDAAFPDENYVISKIIDEVMKLDPQ